MKFFTSLTSVIFILLTVSFSSKAQVDFVNANGRLSETEIHSGCPATVVDVNGDGLDDIVRLDQAHLLYIDYQRPGLQFDHNYIGDFGGGGGWAWAMCAADVDHNGYKDILAGGYGPSVKIFKINSTGNGGTLYSLPSSNFFLQNTNFADINNDGWEDIFGCDDNSESHIWLNNGIGNFTTSSIIDFDVTNTDDSGNYGSVWTDFDNDGDIDLCIAKCRQGISNPSDGRRIDVLMVNDGNNNYTSDAAAYGLADSAETWTCNFADIDNDGDLDAIQVESDEPCKLLENDGTGHMTNITAGSGFELSITALESVMEDFDNDGFVDILVTGTDYNFFHNNGDHTFTKMPGLFGTNNMESFGVGDLNHDGKIDLYASYAILYTTPTNIDDVYWMNTSSPGNHFITLNLIGTVSNEGALGARAEIYGGWGKQIREVHAGESYGTCNTSNLHFGMGSFTSVDSIIVRWPSGAVTSIVNPAVDQFITIKENVCVSPDLTVTASGSTTLCQGDSVTLTASSVPADYSYLWSDGITASQSLVVTTAGDYGVKISSSNGCYSNSAIVTVLASPDETPVITASGETTFCAGGSLVLSASSASSYLWSTGATTQSITVTGSGSYIVTTDGACQLWTSAPLNVIALESTPPVSDDVHLNSPGIATLTATGDVISWYEVPTGGNPIGLGSSFTTPYLNVNTVYYAENATPYGADTLYAGQVYHQGTLYSGSNTTNSYIEFAVINSCLLASVKVYTDLPGERLIELRSTNGDVLQSSLINIPADSSRITLNFSLTPGNYQLGTNSDQNILLWGHESPYLERSSSGVNYPYVIPDLISLNGNDQQQDNYYYFYDWEVQKFPTYCISERTPVTVFIDNASGISQAVKEENISLYPNPSEGLVMLKSSESIAGIVNLQLADVTGRIISSQFENGLLKGEEVTLDYRGVAKGVYFLRIKDGIRTMQRKIIIE